MTGAENLRTLKFQRIEDVFIDDRVRYNPRFDGGGSNSVVVLNLSLQPLDSLEESSTCGLGFFGPRS
jgi:hypothetical protein